MSTDLSAWGDSPLWHIFDNSNSTKFGAGTTSGGYILWELPLSLKITEFSMVQTTETTYLDRFPQDVILYGSNNGTDFTECTYQIPSASTTGYTYTAEPIIDISGSLFSYFRLIYS